jgi:hypothetical protein
MIRKFRFATLRATVAANYRALKLAVALDKAHPHLLKFEVDTQTIERTDFYLPTVADSQRKAKMRQLNSVIIRISRITE